MSARLLPAVLAVLLAGCVDLDPMQQQERDDPYSEDPSFKDQRASRPLVPGTVAQDWYRAQAAFTVHQNEDAGWVDRPPVALSRELLHEGRGLFEAWCAACHGLLADGNSVVARNMQLRPAPAMFGPLHRGHPALSAAQFDGGVPDAGPGGVASVTAGWEALPHPAGFYYSVITEGYGLMPPYADALTPAQRWAVVAYLRALAYSQLAPLSDAPPAVQAELQRPGSTGGAP